MSLTLKTTNKGIDCNTYAERRQNTKVDSGIQTTGAQRSIKPVLRSGRPEEKMYPPVPRGFGSRTFCHKFTCVGGLCCEEYFVF
jgi:hypothetical protein